MVKSEFIELRLILQNTIFKNLSIKNKIKIRKLALKNF